MNAPAPVAAKTPGSLKLASWNLEHLAERGGVGCRPRSEADYAALRRHVSALDADVIAFQEVESRAAAQRVFDPTRYDVLISGRPASGRGGSCYGNPGQTIGHQAVGFAIRRGVRWTRNPDLAALAVGNPDLRWGVDITVQGARPMRLLALHLKSGCNSGRTSTDADCPVLFSQLPVLERWIDARAAAGETFAVLGDWNRRLAARGDTFYAEIDDADPGDADLALAAGDRQAGCKARYREFIDHIVLGARAAQRLVPNSFEEYRYGDVQEAEHPSDHCPVSVRLGWP
ncbi:endonuclease/exonuclease/phosphatase family protein [Sphingomonas turrisvirgatae]|jgi:endonuclease/exonuclease/phosphatase family metal-dependent hydrolase|nr:endonuclease/exonuclease/phosphatase family protein [Sphingomonas turrisvirgatae]